jgi:AcrR family transcriptional regulator
MQEHFVMKRPTPDSDYAPSGASEAGTTRARILDAAFEVLREHGYGATQTREIAARAKVSKRDIYSEFGSKDGIFAAMIAARAESMRRPAMQPDVSSRDAFAATLRQVGLAFLEQLYDPAVVSMFRLAIASVESSPEIARMLNRNAFQPNGRALAEMMSVAIDAGILTGEPSELSSRFFALLTGGAHVPVLLGFAEPPKPRELAQHVDDVAAAFLQLHGRATKRGARSKP